MLKSSLHPSDDLGEHGESDHNAAVAYFLGRAYSCLRQASQRSNAYSEAAEFARACLSLSMSRRQRMRLHYTLGSASIGLHHYSEGITQLNEAIEWAAELPDPGAYAEMAYLAASASGQLCWYRAAGEYASIGVGILRLLAGGQDSVDVELEVETLVQLALSEFALARYTTALEHMKQARQLTAPPPPNIEAISLIAWMEALLYRWCGEPELALDYAIAATDSRAKDAESTSSLAEVGRMNWLVTEIALDLAEALSASTSSTGNNAYIELAVPYMKRSVQKAHQTNDSTGLGLALLAEARHDRVAGRNLNRVKRIEAVIQQGYQSDDLTVLSQAYTELGREFAARGQAEAALDCYRRALDTVEGTDIPGLGLFAWRALLLTQEMQG
jgi:tetratricopeptide (TPR) repeat protein